MISTITATVRRNFNLLIGSNKLATLDDVNRLGKMVQAQMFYRPYHVLVNQSAQLAPVFTDVMVGRSAYDPEGAGTCGNACTAWAPTENCGCPDKTRFGSAALVTGVTRTGTGVYVVSFNQANLDVKYADRIAVTVDAPSVPTHSIAIDKSDWIANRRLIIRTYDLAGAALIDGALIDNVIEFKFYSGDPK